MKYTIEDLANGKCAVKNDGTLEQLREVLGKAFPKDDADVKDYNEKYEYYYLDINGLWSHDVSTHLPTQSVADFLEPQFKRGDRVLVSNDGNAWEERIYLYTIDNSKTPYIVVHHWDNKNYKEGDKFHLSSYSYIKALPEPKEVHLTLKDISEGKGVGVDPKLIRIKE